MKSSVVASVGYDADTRTMEVEFNTGRTYQYFEIPSDVHASLVSAKSIGQYFNTQIRDRYRCHEITKK